uniref:Uncharacterized protein n=1 Tax=Salix viminalis TaxID=40686 RepID=A0A6N2MIL6_SALVM
MLSVRKYVSFGLCEEMASFSCFILALFIALSISGHLASTSKHALNSHHPYPNNNPIHPYPNNNSFYPFPLPASWKLSRPCYWSSSFSSYVVSSKP